MIFKHKTEQAYYTIIVYSKDKNKIDLLAKI